MPHSTAFGLNVLSVPVRELAWLSVRLNKVVRRRV